MMWWSGDDRALGAHRSRVGLMNDVTKLVCTRRWSVVVDLHDHGDPRTRWVALMLQVYAWIPEQKWIRACVRGFPLVFGPLRAGRSLCVVNSG